MCSQKPGAARHQDAFIRHAFDDRTNGTGAPGTRSTGTGRATLAERVGAIVGSSLIASDW